MKTLFCLFAVAAVLSLNPINRVTARGDKDKSKNKNSLYERKGDKVRIYNVPYEKMWAACMKAASEENVVEFSDKETGILTYKSGMSMSSWGFKVSVSLTKIEENKTRIKLTTQKTRGQLFAWGAGDRTVNKFFNGLDKILDETKENAEKK